MYSQSSESITTADGMKTAIGFGRRLSCPTPREADDKAYCPASDGFAQSLAITRMKAVFSPTKPGGKGRRHVTYYRSQYRCGDIVRLSSVEKPCPY
jgi:hypothetical protein